LKNAIISNTIVAASPDSDDKGSKMYKGNVEKDEKGSKVNDLRSA
jgi:hypothetical protein